jgi:hypothetical protein
MKIAHAAGSYPQIYANLRGCHRAGSRAGWRQPGRVVSLLVAMLLMTACRTANPAAIVTAVASPTIQPSPVIVLPTSTPAPTPTPSPTPRPPLKQLTSGGCCVQPSWSPDSKQVWILDKPSADAPPGTYAVNIDEPMKLPFRVLDLVGLYSRDLSLVAYPDGRDTIVERLKTGERWTIPNQGQAVVFSPDAKRIAWEIEESNADQPFDQRRAQIYLARFDGEDPVLVATVYGGGLVDWIDDQRILFSGRPSLDVRERTLVALDITHNVAIDLVTAERIGGIAISPGGSWLVYFITFDEDASRNGIWIQRTEDGSGARRLDFWGAYQWRDDSRLLYIPVRASGSEPFVIWEYDPATGASRPVTDPGTALIEIANGDWRVSPDGRYVVYLNNADRNLWLVELEK